VAEKNYAAVTSVVAVPGYYVIFEVSFRPADPSRPRLAPNSKLINAGTRIVVQISFLISQDFISHHLRGPLSICLPPFLLPEPSMKKSGTTMSCELSRDLDHIETQYDPSICSTEMEDGLALIYIDR